MNKEVRKRAWIFTSERSLPRRSDRLRGDAAKPRARAEGLKIALNLDAYEQKVWMMRQPTTSNRPSWKQGAAISHGASLASDHGHLCVSSMLTQTTRKPKYMQCKGKAPKFFQTTVGGFTKPGKIGEVELQVRQPQNRANKIAGFRDEWKKEERANHQGGRIAMRSRRCDRARWETLMAKGHCWLATMENLVTVAWKETGKEHKNYVAERIKRRNEKLNEADANCDNEESRWIHYDELPGDSPNTG